MVDVYGTFAQQEAVRLVAVDRLALGSLSLSAIGDGSSGSTNRPLSFTMKGEEVGRAVVNYASSEILRIKGMRSSEIQNILGYADSEYIALRENVSLHASVERSRPETPLGIGTRTPEKASTPEASVADLRDGG